MGVTWQEFWDMNPHIIKLLQKGHQEKIKIEDEKMWIMGMYVASALDSTVCNAFLWRGKGSKPHNYIEKPILSAIEKKDEEIGETQLTEEEKKKQTEKLFMQLRIMGANFNLNKDN